MQFCRQIRRAVKAQNKTKKDRSMTRLLFTMHLCVHVCRPTVMLDKKNMIEKNQHQMSKTRSDQTSYDQARPRWTGFRIAAAVFPFPQG